MLASYVYNVKFFSLYLILVLKIQFFFILTERVHEGRQLLSKFFNFLEAVAWRGPVVRTESECPRKLNSRFVVVSVSVAKIRYRKVFFLYQVLKPGMNRRSKIEIHRLNGRLAFGLKWRIQMTLFRHKISPNNFSRNFFSNRFLNF